MSPSALNFSDLSGAIRNWASHTAHLFHDDTCWVYYQNNTKGRVPFPQHWFFSTLSRDQGGLNREWILPARIVYNQLYLGQVQYFVVKKFSRTSLWKRCWCQLTQLLGFAVERVLLLRHKKWVGGGGKLLKTLPPGLRLPGRLRAASLLGFAALLCLLADGADELVGKKESAQRYPASLLAITEHRSQRCSSHVHAFAANSCALAHQLWCKKDEYLYALLPSKLDAYPWFSPVCYIDPPRSL